MHTADVFRTRFLTHKDRFFFFCSKFFRFSGGKTNLTGCSAGNGGNSADKGCRFQIRLLIVDRRIEDAFNIACLDAHNRFFFCDKSFLHHIDRHFESGDGRTLTGTALKHIKRTLFYRELHILHIFIVLFQKRADFTELIIGFFIFFFKFGKFDRRTDARNDIFALRIKEIITVKHIFAAIGIPRKTHAGTGCVAFVAEYHLHNVYCSAFDTDKVFDTAIDDRFFCHP